MMKKILLFGMINMLSLCSVSLASQQEEVAEFRGHHDEWKRKFGERIQVFLLDYLAGKMTTSENSLNTGLSQLETCIKSLVCTKFEALDDTLKTIDCTVKHTENKVECTGGLLACADAKLCAIETIVSCLQEKTACLFALVRSIECVARDTECIERQINCQIIELINLMNCIADATTDCPLINLSQCNP